MLPEISWDNTHKGFQEVPGNGDWAAAASPSHTRLVAVYLLLFHNPGKQVSYIATRPTLYKSHNNSE
jgi:hypothetical protein